MNMNNKVYDAVKMLIQISKNSQESRPDLKESMGYGLWLREFCTIRVGCARQAGHTTAISRLVKENNMKLGVIFGNHTMQSLFRDKEDLVFSLTMQNYEEELREKKFSDLDGVVVDTSFLMSQRKRDALPGIFRSVIEDEDRPFFIILLQ